MPIHFKIATPGDADTIGTLVVELTREICLLTKAKHFDLDLTGTISRCRSLLSQGHYQAIIAFAEQKPIAVATMAETYALYAGGKMGIVPEFYVEPNYRSSGCGSQLLAQVKEYGGAQAWSCLELCTPPLPEFERTMMFYQSNGLTPVGGRKMRIMLG